MDLTWERIVPDAIDPHVTLQQRLLQQHVERYEFAGKKVAGRRVIDAACGTGYGSAMLKRAGASSVLGLDIDPQTVAYARQRYALDGVDYQTANLEQCDFSQWDFDALVSFETIEHLDNPESLLRRWRARLPGDGLLLASVPTVPTLDINEFHKHDFTRASWRDLVAHCGFRIQDELLQSFSASIKDLTEDRKAPNSPKTGARQHPFRYYLRHPLQMMRRTTRLLHCGMEFEVLTVVASPR
jgi:2-polyprenyl-3-methyl-5-hydroxy-6-metoxy-1,4-benzoquinol methylase